MTDYIASSSSADGRAHDEATQRAPSLTLSFGRCATDNRPTARTLTFEDLVHEFSTPDLGRGTLTAAEYHALDKADPLQKAKRSREKDGPYFVPCCFIGDGRRCNDNVESLCGLAFDFDSGGTTETDIRQRLDRYTYLAYTSYSHQAACEKWRVLLLYQDPISKDEHASVFRHFQELFLGDIDPRCETASQLWYTPACPKDAAHEFRAFHAIGSLFNPQTLSGQSHASNPEIPRGAQGTEVGAQSDTLERLQEALLFISADDRKFWVDFGIAIKHDLREAGLAAWLEWSGRSKKFDLSEALETWTSFKLKSTGPKITLATIFYVARERGWKDGEVNHQDDVTDERIDKADALAKFNQKFAVVRTGNGLRILEEHRGSSGRVERVSLFNQTDFALAVKNWRIPGDNKTEPSNWWLRHRERREYSAIDFNPGGHKEGEYNLWQGFGVSPRAGTCSLFWQFIHEVICSGDPEQYGYIRRYMAHAIQRPNERPEAAIVLRGGQGTGKNTFVEFFGALVAPHFQTLNHMDQVIGRFNAHLMNCLVLHANEALWGGKRNEAGKLKAMVTDPTFQVEQKGIDSLHITNYLRIFVSSNEEWAVAIDSDDRRFVVLDLSECHKQDRPYFAAIHKEMNNGGLEALMYDLQNEDLAGFHPRVKPRSKFGFDMKVRSANSVIRWWYECLQAGYMIGEPGQLDGTLIGEGTWETSRPKDWVRFAYGNWCRHQNERHPEDGPVLFKQLKRLLPEMGDHRPTDAKSRKRQWCSTFPELKSARLSFEKAMNAAGQIDWPAE